MEEGNSMPAKVFTSPERPHIPFVDLLTWTFGNPSYDLDKPIFVDASSHDRTLSYNSILNLVRKLIGGFKAYGLQPGDSVCLHSANNINYVLVFLAVIGSGGCFVGSNPHYTVPELTHLLKIAEVKFIITEEDLLKNIRAAAAISNIPSDKTFIFDTFSSYGGVEFKSWKFLLEYPDSDWVKFDDEILAKNTVAALMSTSGTTGMPKAAKCSHYTQVAQSIMLVEIEKPYEVTRLLFLPQFHAFNAPLSLIAPIREGHTTYIIKKYQPDEFVKYLGNIKPTETTVVNPIIYKLLQLEESKRGALQSLRAVWCGGVPLDVSLQNKFRGILHPDAIVKQVWGLTEAGWVASLKYPENDDTGSAGRLLPGMEARIIDEKGLDVYENDIQGEILLRGPGVMMGYFRNEAATKETIKDGWLHTGDVGYQRDGKWYIVDRIKELIKVRGWQVSPAELETCLFTHPAILDVAVIGVDFGDERGELPRAYVVLNPEFAATTTDENIRSFLVGKLSRYKALDGGVFRVDSLPRSSTGKVLKKSLKEQAKLEVLEAKMKATTLSEANYPGNSLVKLVDEKPTAEIPGTLIESPNSLDVGSVDEGPIRLHGDEKDVELVNCLVESVIIPEAPSIENDHPELLRDYKMPDLLQVKMEPHALSDIGNLDKNNLGLVVGEKEISTEDGTGL